MFADRIDAGQRLGATLREFIEQECAGEETVVLALPRGGVPVGYQVAKALDAPLDVFVVRKLGAPTQPELAMGAIASGGVRVINEEVVRALHVTPQQMEDTAKREGQELERREHAYRGNRAPLDVTGRCVLLVDDGVATGYTMRAAVEALRHSQPKEIVVTVPVAARETCEELKRHADAIVCLFTPFDFVAVGQWYKRFEQTSDEEVRLLLERAAERTDSE
ncbi:MAG TPA: phosphoribosyltransferase [Acidobacteriaceae bacterium]|nr:phosphoribosyltransferase [Acidobacteriaceae bacterium]